MGFCLTKEARIMDSHPDGASDSVSISTGQSAILKSGLERRIIRRLAQISGRGRQWLLPNLYNHCNLRMNPFPVRPGPEGMIRRLTQILGLRGRTGKAPRLERGR